MFSMNSCFCTCRNWTSVEQFSSGFKLPQGLGKIPKVFFFLHGHVYYYRKRGSASYIVREVLSVRERERERERKRERLIPKTIGNRKRDCAWGCAWGINTTWENLQIEKHKSVRWAERTPSWLVLFDLQIFSDGVYSPSATLRTISFSISNSFWY